MAYIARIHATHSAAVLGIATLLASAVVCVPYGIICFSDKDVFKTALLIPPISCAVVFFTTLVLFWAYNKVAESTGGIKIDIKEKHVKEDKEKKKLTVKRGRTW